MGRKMSKGSQVAFAKKYIKNQGMDPDKVDLDNLIDGKLSYKDNLAKIKKQLKKPPANKIGKTTNKIGPGSRKIFNKGSKRKKKSTRVKTGQPVRWSLAMIKAIKKSSDVEDPARIVRTIWHRLSSTKQAQIRQQEAAGAKFRINLPVPEDSNTSGPGIMRIVKPLHLVELQHSVGSRLFKKFKESGMFQVMRSKKYGDRLVRRCKSKKGNLNIFVDK